MINPDQRIVIHGLGNVALQPMLESARNLLKIVEAEDSEDLMLESVTLEEIEHVYLGNSDFIPADSAMFEAISTQRQQLATTMRAFTRVLNRGLQGTDISGGVENAPDGDDSGTVVGGALIGKVRRIAGVPVIAAKIPLSDGQSTSIVFHSPTSNGKTLVNSDLLVAFQFLVNKRDVTHVVAPIGGKDVSLAQVAQSLSNLIEKNSGKFQKQQAMQKKMKDDIDALQNEADKLENERSTVMQQFNDAQNQATQVSSQMSSLSDQLAKQKSINSDLQKQLDSLQNAPAPAPSQAVTDNLRNIKQSINIDGKATLSNGSTIDVKTIDDGTYAILQTPAGETYQLEAKDIQGASVNDAVGKLFKAYRAGKADKYKVDNAVDAVSDTTAPATDPEPTPEPEPAANTETGLDDKQPDPMDVAQTNFTAIANLSGVSADSVASWWANNGNGNTALSDLKDALTAAPSTANIEALKSAIDFGNTFSADDVNPIPEPSLTTQQDPEPEPESATTPQPEKAEGNDVPDLDQQSNDAIAALKALLTYQSDDTKAIGEKLQEAQNAAQALVEAGTYENNESLVNDVANNLIQLMAEIQKKGA